MASSLVAALLAITFILICLHIFRLSIVNKKDPVRSCRKGKTPRKLLISLGSGGHTSEMLQMLRTMDLTTFDTRIYYISSGDALSHQKATSFEEVLKKESEDGSYRIRTLSRARRVKQSWWSTPLTATISFLDALRFTYVDQPDLLLCNGPGTCVMIVLSILVLKVGLYRCFGRVSAAKS